MNTDKTTRAMTCEGVASGYRKIPVLTDISCAIPAGNFVGVIGPNGSGKTTFLRTLTGLLPALRGTVRIFDEDISRLSAPERARRIGVVPQAMDPPMNFTVDEMLMIGRTASMNRWAPPSPSDHTAIEKALHYTDTLAMRNRFYTELSGGEKQRVIMAMALARNPNILLLDEATAHLDMNHRMELLERVAHLNRENGTTIVMVSHDLNLSAEFCERLLLFDGGHLVADGLPETVLTPDHLEAVYHCPVRIDRNPATNTLRVTPLRKPVNESDLAK